MRKLYLMFIPLLLIVACQNDPDQTEDDPPLSEEQTTPEKDQTDETDEAGDIKDKDVDQEQTDEQQGPNEYMEAKMDELSFYEIELEVEYVDGKEYEIKIEKDDNRPYKAQIEDELNNMYLNGEAAFDELYPKVEQLQLSSESDQSEVIEQVLDIFNLADNYTTFEIEVKFHDGSELDFEIKR